MGRRRRRNFGRGRKNLCKRRAWQKLRTAYRRRRRKKVICRQSEETKKGEEILKRNEDRI